MKKTFVSVTLITAALTFLTLSRLLPNTEVSPKDSPVMASTATQSSLTTERTAPVQALQLQTVQVGSPKLLLRHTRVHRSKPRAETTPKIPSPTETADATTTSVSEIPIAEISSSMISPLDLSLLPSAIVLPARELNRVSPLLLQKRNPS